MITHEVQYGHEPEDIKSCSLCQSDALIEDIDTGEVICSNCGLVVREKNYSLEQTWRAYNLTEERERSRSGYALTNKIYDKGLSTTFNSDYGLNGKKLDIETRNKMARLKKQDERTKVNDSWQRNLRVALSEMSSICIKLNLPDHVHEKAAYIYRKVLMKDLVRGRSIDGFVSASVYAACRKTGVPRSLSEIVKASNQTEHIVKYHYRLIVKELDFKPPIDKPTKFISSLSSKLKLNGLIEANSLKILREAQNRRLVMGKNPRGVAAAILYLACVEEGVRITQAEVAKAANTSEVTMRKRFNEYASFLKKPLKNPYF